MTTTSLRTTRTSLSRNVITVAAATIGAPLAHRGPPLGNTRTRTRAEAYALARHNGWL